MPDLGTPYSKTGFPTNNHPVEGKSISAIVSEREQQLDTVLRDVSALETVMVGIKNLHQSLVEQKHKIIQSKLLHIGFVSVAGRLPTEILSQIFYYSLPEHEYLSPALKQAPMLLTSICRRWREVAVGMPSLWCRLYVAENLQRAAFCYNSWLQRSRGHPLSLALGSQPSVYLRRHLIQPYINQIRSLLVFFSRGERRPEVVFGDLPALQELTISGLDPYSPAFVRSISFLPPSMRSLNVMNMRPHFDLELIDSCRLMWANLTNVEIAIRNRMRSSSCSSHVPTSPRSRSTSISITRITWSHSRTPESRPYASLVHIAPQAFCQTCSMLYRCPICAFSRPSAITIHCRWRRFWHDQSAPWRV